MPASCFYPQLWLNSSLNSSLYLKNKQKQKRQNSGQQDWRNRHKRYVGIKAEFQSTWSQSAEWIHLDQELPVAVSFELDIKPSAYIKSAIISWAAE
jgi:hypothetical protein